MPLGRQDLRSKPHRSDQFIVDLRPIYDQPVRRGRRGGGSGTWRRSTLSLIRRSTNNADPSASPNAASWQPLAPSRPPAVSATEPEQSTDSSEIQFIVRTTEWAWYYLGLPLSLPFVLLLHRLKLFHRVPQVLPLGLPLLIPADITP